jgi:Rrf2 family protein
MTELLKSDIGHFYLHLRYPKTAYNGCQRPFSKNVGEIRVLSQTVEYALRAVVMLAQDPETPRTVEDMATVTKVPAAYLAKILQGLVKRGVLQSQRGVGGGIRLAADPAHVTILEIVNAVDPIQRIRTCPLGLSNHGVNLCPLHRRLDNALALVEAAFADSTLADVLSDSHGSLPLCGPRTARLKLGVRGRRN